MRHNNGSGRQTFVRPPPRRNTCGLFLCPTGCSDILIHKILRAFVTNPILIVFILFMMMDNTASVTSAVAFSSAKVTTTSTMTSGSGQCTGAVTVIIGLNGALQKRLILGDSDLLVPGQVHHASHVQFGVGGKGQDVAMTLHCLEYRDHYSRREHSDPSQISSSPMSRPTTSASPPPIQLAQFVGQGPSGDLVLQLLRDQFSPTLPSMLVDSDLNHFHLPSQHKQGDHENGATIVEYKKNHWWGTLTVRPASHMRTCTSIVDQRITTELIEPSGTITKADLNQLLSKLLQGSSSFEVGALCFMGTIPPGCPKSTYAQIWQRLVERKTPECESCLPRCLIDSVMGLDPLMQQIASLWTKIRLHLSSTGNSIDTTSTTRRHDYSREKRLSRAILKINVSELRRLAGFHDASKTDNMEGVLPSNLVSYIHGFLHRSHPYGKQSLDALAITDGAHTAYMAILSSALSNPDDQELSSEVPYQLFRSPIVNLQSQSSMALFPFGAGDAVAAGTLAAWQCMTDSPHLNGDGENHQTNGSTIHPNLLTVLWEREKEFDLSPPNNSNLDCKASNL